MNTSTKPPRRVVIAGGGTAGWMMATLMGKLLGKQLDIKLIESEEIGTVGVGEATIPALLTYHNLLGITEAEFMAATNATFKLGIKFEGWKDISQDYFHSFGSTGNDHWSAGFQHFWLKGRAAGIARDYTDYNPETLAAYADRFGHVPRNGLNYAYHLDAGRYAKYLRAMSEGYGVQRIEGKIAAVLMDGPEGRDGDITALQMQDGSRIDGDLFIDCTGFRAMLIGEALGVGYEDWSHWLPCDRAVAVQTASVREAWPYTRSIAHPFGWQWRIPLQHRVGNGLVYSSKELSDADAPEMLKKNVEGEVLIQPRVIKFLPGQRHKVWHRNCIAVGLASGFIEPLESTSIHLIQRSAIRLMQLFPTQGINPADVNEFNLQCERELTHIRDFIILHYHVTHRSDSALWNHVRTMEVPATLRHRIDLFTESARVFRPSDELFAENSWIQVMMGQGITPHSYHPVADLMGPSELNQFLGDIHTKAARIAGGLHGHQAYVEQLCAPYRNATTAQLVPKQA
ncbi:MULTISPECIES: tryptophan halogenase family protein [unclassified Roseateles]|uniref:tryptophan halogenase family protein n=1 Tax=unclassified Roseateles TaxID=2626991 RepID=UPI0006FF415D|nr:MULTISPECIES: tryptophan halogenase family protein [unclassified Roseateles]KQW42951.1 tryptophan halogenase [Pelomonas sp. Root405]KRA69629.1 tryptophan halogenase [Pelomonas sp. Root662]